jgi:hypothetical protein
VSHFITPPTSSTPSGSQDLPGSPSDLEAFQAVVRALSPLNPEMRQRIFDAAATFLGLAAPRPSTLRSTSESGPASSHQRPSYSDDTSMSPKQFLLEKQPQTDVERVACLAYYLTHYRDQPHFKTLDISKLNTEAAQPKFSNAANSVNNSVKRRYLVPSTKGLRQLSAAGERFVLALPDRSEARQAMVAFRPRRSSRRSRPSSMSEHVTANSEA